MVAKLSSLWDSGVRVTVYASHDIVFQTDFNVPIVVNKSTDKSMDHVNVYLFH